MTRLIHCSRVAVEGKRNPLNFNLCLEIQVIDNFHTISHHMEIFSLDGSDRQELLGRPDE